MLEKVEDILAYRFQDKALLEKALTHPSATRDGSSHAGKKNYERLEFLGDAVLGLIIAEFLVNHFPDDKEGGLAKRQAALVCGEAISSVARTLDIADCIIMGPSECTGGGRENDANLENVLEALIGAIYLDGGLDAATTFVSKHWFEMGLDMTEPPQDPKTALQEWAQARSLPLPNYETVDSEGPSHAPIFTVQLTVEGRDPVTALGPSKKIAERAAAELLLKKINKS